MAKKRKLLHSLTGGLTGLSDDLKGSSHSLAIFFISCFHF